MLMTTTPTVMSVAAQFGADAVVWIDPDYEVLGTENRMLMVAASGAAMVLE